VAHTLRIAEGISPEGSNNEVEAHHCRPGRGVLSAIGPCRGNSRAKTRPGRRRKARCLGNCALGSKRPTQSAPASAPIERSAALSWFMPRTGTSFTSKATRAARSTKAPCVRRGRRHSAG
jgi:hypothetical protein